MNKYDSNASIDDLHQHSDKESPPFAVDDYFSSLTEQHHDEFQDTSVDSSKPSTHPPTKNLEVDSRDAKITATDHNKSHSVMSSYSQFSSNSLPPDLTESTMTDGTSCCSGISATKSEATKSMHHIKKISSPPILSRHSSIFSSILSTSSLKSVPLEPRLPNADSHPVGKGSFKTTSARFEDPHTTTEQPGTNSSVFGFSELMKAADDSNLQLEQSSPTTHVSDHRSNGRLPPLPEHLEAECGTIISAAPEYEPIRRIPETARRDKFQKWWRGAPSLGSGSHEANDEFERPLLTTTTKTNSNDATSGQLHITRLLSNDSLQRQCANLALERAIASVHTRIESDDSFEVSFLLGENAQCTVDDVMKVVSNVDLLNQWYDPVETLIVTSNSSEGSSFPMSLNETRTKNECEDLSGSSHCQDGNKRIREYEAEWIEATTSSLESPQSGFSFILDIGKSVLRSVGLESYGKITMFTERRQGHISLTAGPFSGGVKASHSISVSMEGPSINGGGRIRIVDRVRLSHNEEGIFSLDRMFGCAMGSCLSHFFLPSIAGYANQVTMSMARLRILLEGNQNTHSPSNPY